MATIIGTSLVLMLAGVNAIGLAAPAVASNPGSQAAKQEPSSSGLLLEAPFSSGDYGSAMDNLVNFGGNLYTNSKRARKMSAFMPMRGRRDNQLFRLFSANGSPLMQTESNNNNNNNENDLFIREVDVDSPSIMRLIAENAAGSSGANFRSEWPIGGTPAPRQFANQLAARHLLMSPGEFYPEGLQLGAGGGGESAGTMMQAKLRRAFHPMRGKRTNGSPFEVNFSEDMQTD